MPRTTVIPTPIRELRAKMALKDLSLSDVSDLAGLPYTTVSAVLRGRLARPAFLKKVRAVIVSAPTPFFLPEV